MMRGSGHVQGMMRAGQRQWLRLQIPFAQGSKESVRGSRRPSRGRKPGSSSARSPGRRLMRAGRQLKDRRTKLGITLRDVQEYSKKIAETEKDADFYISNGRLTQIENSDSKPSIHKLFSLSVIYGTNYSELLALFGVELQAISKYQLSRSRFGCKLSLPDPKNL